MKREQRKMRDNRLLDSKYWVKSFKVVIGFIPIIGNIARIVYFEFQNKKRLKYIETFYKQLEECFSQFEKSQEATNQEKIKKVNSTIKLINEQIENIDCKEKIIYYVNAYKNLISANIMVDSKKNEHLIKILSSISTTEIIVLETMYQRVTQKQGWCDEFSNLDISSLKTALNRLEVLELIVKQLKFSNNHAKESPNYLLTSLGVDFCYYILK